MAEKSAPPGSAPVKDDVPKSTNSSSMSSLYAYFWVQQAESSSRGRSLTSPQNVLISVTLPTEDEKERTLKRLLPGPWGSLHHPVLCQTSVTWYWWLTKDKHLEGRDPQRPGGKRSSVRSFGIKLLWYNSNRILSAWWIRVRIGRAEKLTQCSPSQGVSFREALTENFPRPLASLSKLCTRWQSFWPRVYILVRGPEILYKTFLSNPARPSSVDPALARSGLSVGFSRFPLV